MNIIHKVFSNNLSSSANWSSCSKKGSLLKRGNLFLEISGTIRIDNFMLIWKKLPKKLKIKPVLDGKNVAKYNPFSFFSCQLFLGAFFTFQEGYFSDTKTIC
jgi:hypothetical protein